GRGGYSRKEPEITDTSIGGMIEQDPMLCRDIDDEMNRCVLEGYIFASESRDVKGGELAIITAKFTDYTDSIYVKMFARTPEAKKAFPKILGKGNWVKVSGKIQFDTFAKELVLMANSVNIISAKTEPRQDLAPEGEKRVELHVHSKMSAMDAVTDISEYVKQAAKWGHKAIALTDHGVLQAIPEAFSAAKKNDIKVIYGVEGYLVDDLPEVAWNNSPIKLNDATYVVYDVETTGFSTNFDVIIEIAAVKIRNGAIIDEFSSFANPHRRLSLKTIELTHILQSDVDQAPELEDVMRDFKEWSGDSILVAHNAHFDMGHLEQTYKRFNLGDCPNPVIDTLELARVMYHHSLGIYWDKIDPLDDEKSKRKLKRFNLKALAKFFKVDLTQHHRAIYDARATGQAFILMLKDVLKLEIETHDQMNTLVDPENSFKLGYSDHVCILAKDQVGFKNLFKVVSQSLTTDIFGGQPKIRRSVLQAHREGLLVGSSCVNGEVWQTAINKPYEELLEKAKFYDYLEVQPPEVYSHLIDLNSKEMAQSIIETIKTIIRAGEELDIPVCATGDVHHLNRDDKIYRQIYTRTPMVGGGRHPLNNPDIKDIPSMHFRTTDEMLHDFSFLGNEKRKEIVVTNPNMIADQCEKIKAIKDDLFTPADDFLKDKGIPSIKDRLTEMCYERAHELYGKELPQYVLDRLEKELKSIIGNGFAVIYYISHMLVKKSLDDGYLVGSRGSVGSSFVATLTDITEVNPLSPHYRCPNCLYTAFKLNEDEKSRYGIRPEEEHLQEILANGDSGFDLPDQNCPHCQTKMKKDGHDIPFETFLGFKGDKVPDIDLNFSGEYQPTAHLYCREVFGDDFAFRAGTIGTVAEKTAFGYVKGFLEDTGRELRSAEIERLASGCEGVRRTSGQHPGGIIVVPNYMDIYDVTPIQYPADDPTAEWRTTHFDFHSIHDNLLKLDILGHDDPTVIRYLQDISGIDPKDIPTDDPEVYKLFYSTESLGVKPDQIRSTTGSYGVPEFGTPFVRNMLEDTKPKTFAELVKISGLSHGTDVWLNNAADLVTGKIDKFGKIEFKNVIGCRDDIMVYLMYGGLEPALAFKIMEFVRKGMASKVPDGWKEFEEEMRKHNIPEWYIWSCGQIKYMFPKAHATAYVLMAIRIAWFKVHHPIFYYCAYFSKRADVFEIETMVKGPDAIRKRLDQIDELGFDATPKEKNLVTILEIALEMTERGFYFQNFNIEESNAVDFKISEDGKSLIPPFTAMDGLGENVARQMVAAREEEPFKTIKEVQTRGKCSKTLIEKLQLAGAFGDMEMGTDKKPVKTVLVPDNQLSLF
ncbi:MAG TPA: PolC-type DNA polymerase III, partial [Firmicutes bacterium]|nr:PolC-type DNA polymerase III [Bacillota bacterium]